VGEFVVVTWKKRKRKEEIKESIECHPRDR
jgi:hypothetical protein